MYEFGRGNGGRDKFLVLAIVLRRTTKYSNQST